jgi:hypothetical protein
VSEAFVRRFLQDPGLDLKHPRKEHLVLSDFYVSPVLRETSPSADEAVSTPRAIPADELYEYVVKHGLVVLLGSERSGKTTLLKSIYGQCQKAGAAAVYLNLEDLSGKPTAENLENLLKQAVEEQYPESDWEHFRQLEPSKKTILADDIDRPRLNPTSRARIVEYLRSAAGAVAVTGTEQLQVEELGAEFEKSLSLATTLLVPEFNHVQRSKLIRRWICIGHEFDADDFAIDLEYKAIEQVIADNIGRNLLPSDPFVILTILQAVEPNVPFNLTSGTYGYLYEMLISKAISAGVTGTAERSKRNGFLSEVAYEMFVVRSKELTHEQIEEVSERYRRVYESRLDTDVMLDALDHAGVLARRNGSHRFLRGYMYCYFLARYFANKLRNPRVAEEVERCIRHMCCNLYRDDYANTMVFLCYLSRDPSIHSILLGYAQSVLRDTEPCKLGDDTAFLNRFSAPPRALALPEGDVDRTREEVLRAQDEAEELYSSADEESACQEVGDVAELDPALRIAFAVKTMQVLGQVLKNFIGDLEGPERLALTREAWLLGLKCLTVAYSSLRSHWDEIAQDVAKSLSDHHAVPDTMSAEQAASSLLYGVACAAGFGMTKVISRSVGSRDLARTYAQIMSEHSEPAFQLVNLSIRLDHFGDPPLTDIKRIYDSTRENTIAVEILIALVAFNIHMYHWDLKKRQQVIRILDLSPKLQADPGSIVAPPRDATSKKKRQRGRQV